MENPLKKEFEFYKKNQKNLVAKYKGKFVVIKDEEVKNFMSKVNPKIKVVKMPRSDHHYPYPEEFRRFLL